MSCAQGFFRFKIWTKTQKLRFLFDPWYLLAALDLLNCVPLPQVPRRYKWLWTGKEDSTCFVCKSDWVSKTFSEELSIRRQQISIVLLTPLHGHEKNNLRALWNQLLLLYKRLTLKVVCIFFLIDCFGFFCFVLFWFFAGLSSGVHFWDEIHFGNYKRF